MAGTITKGEEAAIQEEVMAGEGAIKEEVDSRKERTLRINKEGTRLRTDREEAITIRRREDSIITRNKKEATTIILIDRETRTNNTKRKDRQEEDTNKIRVVTKVDIREVIKREVEVVEVVEAAGATVAVAVEEAVNGATVSPPVLAVLVALEAQAKSIKEAIRILRRSEVVHECPLLCIGQVRIEKNI